MAERRPEPFIENRRNQRRRSGDEPEPRRQRTFQQPQQPPSQQQQQQQQQQHHAPDLPILPNDGTDLTYAQLFQVPAQDPVPEEYNPELIPALWEPDDAASMLWEYDGQPVQDPDDGPPLISLLPNVAEPTHAYAFLPDAPVIQLHHADGWGCIRFAVVYPHHVGDPPMVFRAPHPTQGNPRYVAIKILNKPVIRQYLDDGGAENPYKEILRMQELGDNIHVIRCEALEDEERLYIVTPKCTRLVDVIFRQRQPLDPATIHGYFLQLLRILVYLEQHQIHHRDLSPDNLFILPNGQLVLVDFAMSLRIPRQDGSRNLRTTIRDQGNFGTPAWMAPEIFHRFPFDGVTADLWCVMHIFYNMVAANLLYRLPTPTDWNYRFFILAGGLANHGMNEQAMEVLQEVAEEGTRETQNEIMNRAMAHLAFPPSIRQLFQHTLVNAPHERWTLGQVLRSNYVVHGPE